ncbi:MAG: hypothetical protein P8I55_13260 [Crocinitomix sp.]|nr:hypothetical protein [Crocinitomix sp.]|tara:strand:- start:1561 stop:1824 length:264 start_codon:yes stop_codon:yes gene_type:complete
MRTYKVNRKDTPKVPSKETIEKYKDFSALSHEYDKMVKRPKVPLYKDKKMFLVLLLVALVAILLSQMGDRKSAEEDSESTNTEQVED